VKTQPPGEKGFAFGEKTFGVIAEMFGSTETALI
jgi:hypothetical protein